MKKRRNKKILFKKDKKNFLILALFFIIMLEFVLVLSFRSNNLRVTNPTQLSNCSNSTKQLYFEKGVSKGSMLGWAEGLKVIVNNYKNCSVLNTTNDTFVSWKCLISKWDDKAKELNEHLKEASV